MPDAVTRDLQLDAEPSVVWAALTDPDELSRWLADEVEFDPVPGGNARFVVDGKHRCGWIEEIRPPGEGGRGVLSFWWQAGDEPASRVSFELTPTNGGTRLRVHETRPLESLDLIGVPLRSGGLGGPAYGPALVAA